MVGVVAAAGLLYGLATVINLLGMQPMATWRQGRRTKRTPADR